MKNDDKKRVLEILTQIGMLMSELNNLGIKAEFNANSCSKKVILNKTTGNLNKV